MYGGSVSLGKSDSAFAPLPPSCGQWKHERKVLHMPVLGKEDVKARLKNMRGWEFDDDEIQKSFKFASFEQSMLFVNAVARLAESADHHPDISIKYDRVKLELSTHSEGGITEKDFMLANQIDASAGTA
jgi:4a-hydroxytetrahydrobiopterin dehydratase